MAQIIVLKQGSERKVYCVDCADSEPLVQAELEKPDDERLEISEDTLGEKCLVCHRQISHVKANPRIYRVTATVTFECEIDVKAVSATQAQFDVVTQLAAGELEIHIPDTKEVRLNDCQYEVVEPVKVLPPEQTMFVSPTHERFRGDFR